ncbi:MAG: hypothetical protein COX34_01060 [Candidatus Nealsonbacteria bacterium CG23_combo_of_CG06-09_8_20_14_all_36_12]|uniref:Vitamin K epoxide reductase domain-containing protein n=2 Tax=Candidatus Nealsoniibacteriota TaxID=1817911 RepID=A0A2H0TLD3_9BACT|nr:MAG: hypothetical protein COX34_01060 [Candidatus Nealsonbacteria bacterium CG23_combo_of_CG06-09_8_20_14_all_36_12]PIR72949.1 MAG: hypothetical protein COV26_01195 [Candidatus Nealsonbacteria bacterium CG10_big_fil_rev_8_21_14_0_10_36_23]
MKKQILFTILLLVIGYWLLVGSAQAALVSCGGKDQEPCQLCDFFVLFQNIVNFVLFKIVPPLAALFLVIGGVMFFFAGASPSTLQTAKKLMTSVMFGLLIIYGAWVFVNTFFMLIGVAEPGQFGFDLRKWWNFPCP